MAAVCDIVTNFDHIYSGVYVLLNMGRWSSFSADQKISGSNHFGVWTGRSSPRYVGKGTICTRDHTICWFGKYHIEF